MTEKSKGVPERSFHEAFQTGPGAAGIPFWTSVLHGSPPSVCILTRSVVSDSVTPQTAVLQAPLLMGFFRQEYWSGLPFPSPSDLPDPGIKPASPVSPALKQNSLSTEPSGIWNMDITPGGAGARPWMMKHITHHGWDGKVGRSRAFLPQQVVKASALDTMFFCCYV